MGKHFTNDVVTLTATGSLTASTMIIRDGPADFGLSLSQNMSGAASTFRLQPWASGGVDYYSVLAVDFSGSKDTNVRVVGPSGTSLSFVSASSTSSLAFNGSTLSIASPTMSLGATALGITGSTITLSGTTINLTGTVNFSGAALPHEVAAYRSGSPGNSEVFLSYIFGRTVSWAGNFAGSYARATTAATSNVSCSIKRNGSAIGSCSFSASATGTFTGSATTWAAGDILTVTAPTSADSTLGGVMILFVGTR